MSDKIQTLHPDPAKQGVNISAEKYDTVRSAIEAVLDEHGTITLAGLRSAVADQIRDTFDGSVGWYVMAVKQDLEARGVIEQVPGARPQQLQRT